MGSMPFPFSLFCLAVLLYPLVPDGQSGVSSSHFYSTQSRRDMVCPSHHSTDRELAVQLCGLTDRREKYPFLEWLVDGI